jgi:peptide/nickel transport system substrate-binding protein
MARIAGAVAPASRTTLPSGGTGGTAAETSMVSPERVKIAQEIWKIICEECWVIGTVGLSPAFMGVRVVKNTMGNIPARQTNAQHVRTPNTSHPATFFFKG